MNINGEHGPHPESLRKMLGQLKTMAKEARRSVSKRRNRVYVGNAPKLPRQFCDVCNSMWDFCSTPGEPKPPQKSRCQACQEMLVKGYTAFTSKSHHAWVMIGPTSNFKSGAVYFISDDAMAVLMKRFKDQSINGQDAPTEA